MKNVTRDNFGLLIAYLLPGFVVLGGLQEAAPPFQLGLGVAAPSAPTVGGFLYATLASILAGMIVSAIRWAVIDRLYHATGIPEPAWDFGKLSGRLAAFETLVEYHYRYYQSYANLLVAVVLRYGLGVVQSHSWSTGTALSDMGFAVIVLVLVLGSRDSLQKYYRRAADLQRSAAKSS